LLLEIYSKASCAIFPSYVESFGMAPLESMNTGCPTIYTKRASGPEIINNGINGLLVDPDDIQEIAKAITYMLTKRTSAKIIGDCGAKTVRDQFSISSIAKSHLIIYSDMITNNSNITR
jgi:glycogen synthase